MLALGRCRLSHVVVEVCTVPHRDRFEIQPLWRCGLHLERQITSPLPFPRVPNRDVRGFQGPNVGLSCRPRRIADCLLDMTV